MFVERELLPNRFGPIQAFCLGHHYLFLKIGIIFPSKKRTTVLAVISDVDDDTTNLVR